MDDSLANKYAKAVAATLGHEGRMISYSKSGYRERHPLHVAIFNASVCVSAGRVWWGDLDLTLSEPQLTALAARAGETVYLLYEGDAPFEHEQQPLLDKAAYSVTPTGHTKFEHAYTERTKEGTLQRRSPEPGALRRWRWRVLRHRPRLWRFWHVDLRRWDGGSFDRTSLLYVGGRGEGGSTSPSPLLVLVLFRGGRLPRLAFEITWYPADNLDRCAPRPLFHIHPTATPCRRLELWLGLYVWPGHAYSLTVGYALKPRRR